MASPDCIVSAKQKFRNHRVAWQFLEFEVYPRCNHLQLWVATQTVGISQSLFWIKTYIIGFGKQVGTVSVDTQATNKVVRKQISWKSVTDLQVLQT
jgi:Tfp pilus assembly major pilin PilA